MDLDRSLDERIARHSYTRPSRGRRGDQYRDPFPRDGVRKPAYRESTRDLDRDWVHDRFEDDRFAPRQDRERIDTYATGPPRRSEVPSAKLRVDNLHYDLTERDIRDLFERIGPVKSAELLYDRSDRSRGIAFVVFEDELDARDAIKEFDGANAYGQPISLAMMPTGPAVSGRGAATGGRATQGRSLFDRVEPRGAIDRSRNESHDTRDSRDIRRPAPSHIDRYVPGDDRSRSPPTRRGAGGRRPGATRDVTQRRGGRRNKDEEGRPVVQGRPKKTVDELDAEMDDYFNAHAEGAESGNGEVAAAGSGRMTYGAQASAVADDDVEMAI